MSNSPIPSWARPSVCLATDQVKSNDTAFSALCTAGNTSPISNSTCLKINLKKNQGVCAISVILVIVIPAINKAGDQNKVHFWIILSFIKLVLFGGWRCNAMQDSIWIWDVRWCPWQPSLWKPGFVLQKIYY